VRLAQRFLGLAAAATTGCSILFGIRAEDFAAGASREAGASPGRNSDADGDVEAGAPPPGDGAVTPRTVCLDPANLQTFADVGAGTIGFGSGSSVELTFASRSSTPKASVRGYSELAASPGLDKYGTLRVRARFRTSVGDAGLESWTPASYVTILAAIAGSWSQVDSVGRVALYVAQDVLALAVFRNGGNTGEIDQTLVSGYPNEYASDVSVTIPLHGAGEISAEVDGGQPVSVDPGLAPASADTVTLLAGGSASGTFSSVTVTITMLCADLMP
jgi:hypothetical protein